MLFSVRAIKAAQEPKQNFLPISFKTSKVAIDENGMASIGGAKGSYVDLLNIPDLATLENWEFGFKASVLSNGDYKIICGIEGSTGSWLGDYAFQVLNYQAVYPSYGAMMYSSSDNNYFLVPKPAISDSNFHDFKVKWEKGIGFTFTVDDASATKYRASFTSNAGKNIRWGHSNQYYTTNINILDTKSVYLKWWNS